MQQVSAMDRGVRKPSPQLILEWAKKLEESGFEDIEYRDGSLKSQSRTTALWQDQEMILEFFRNLDDFLAKNKIPIMHRKILEMYSRGCYLKDIGPKVGVSQSTAQRVIRKYSAIVKGVN